ncbi:MAG: sugar phosphate isomerase/epimerase family protein [Promethearchaeota archaeon]
MQFSSCITNPNIIKEPFEKIVEQFISAGFEGIDIPCYKENFAIDKIKPILESYPALKVPEITAMINPSRDLVHPDRTKRQIAINYIKECIDVANALEVNLTHMCFISFKDNLEKTNRNTLEKYAIESIRTCAKYAEERHVRLMIEPLFKGDMTIINKCEQAVDLWCKALNIDEESFMTQNQFGLLQDIFHMHCEEDDLLKAIEKYKKITFHMHVADHLRGLDFLRKDSDFVKEAINLLKKLNYKYFISFETFDKSVSFNTLKEALKTIKSFRFKF